MRYTSVLDAATIIVCRLGRGTVLAKIDLPHAYQGIPVHPDDHPLLAIKWDQDIIIDTALPFGLRSVPKIFSAFADALAWVLESRGIKWQLHYLDDFLFLGPPGSSACANALELALTTCRHLGVPVAMHKTEGPSTQLTFLGIQINTDDMSLSLADDKLTRIRSLVLSWRSRQSATKRELQSLIGHLSHAAWVVLPGRTFPQRIIDLMNMAKLPHHHVRLMQNVSLTSSGGPPSSQDGMAGRFCLIQSKLMVTSDASGTWGCGAVTHYGKYFQVKWPDSWSEVNIAVKEMVPVVIATAIWGEQWAERTVLVRSDNMAVVHVLSAGTARDARLMHLLRCLHFFSARHLISIRAKHVAGVFNSAADALSRNNMSVIFQHTPQAAKEPSQVPDPLIDMLVLHRPDWTSASWRTMFLSTWARP